MNLARLASIIAISFLAIETKPVSAQNGIFFERRSESNRLVLFVHGILGDVEKTWEHDRSQARWPDLLTKDEAFSGVDVASYQYPTSVFESNFSIDEVADHLRARIQVETIDKQYDEIAIIAHSMGGLVVRNFLLKFRDVDLLSPQMVLFLSTPTNGSDLANYASVFSSNKQLEGLKSLEENQVLQLISSQWLASDFKGSIRSYCAYETRETMGITVVSRASGTALCNQRLDPIPENHFRIAKPADSQADVYISFKVAFGETFAKQQLVDDVSDLLITPDTNGLGKIIVADQLTISGNVSLQDGTLIIANDISMQGAIISSHDISIVAASISGGQINARGASSEDGGDVLLAAGRIFGTQVNASGGAGDAGSDGSDGGNGQRGERGRDGRCDGFGRYRGNRAGTAGTDGGDGGNGQDGYSGGAGGTISIVALGASTNLSAIVDGGLGGRGGLGGQGGRGGQGGQGGRGCVGLGGSQTNASNGGDGIDGRTGRSGDDGSNGENGIVWEAQIEDFGNISELVPSAQEIGDYSQDIVSSLRSLAKSGG